MSAFLVVISAMIVLGLGAMWGYGVGVREGLARAEEQDRARRTRAGHKAAETRKAKKGQHPLTTRIGADPSLTASLARLARRDD